MRNRMFAVMMAALVAAGSGLTGCGGGGGGGGGGSDLSANYTGNTAQATLTAGNAKELSIDVMDDVQSASGVGSIAKSVPGAAAASPRVLAVETAIENSILRITAKSTAKTAAATTQGTEYGYSGSYSYTANGNDVTGEFSGSITYNQYQELADTAVLSGTIAFAGVYSQALGEFASLNITVTNLQGTEGAESFVMNGSMAMVNSGIARTLGFSLVLLDVASARTYWMKDFSLVLSGGTMTISGTYYDHIHGFVVVSTLAPLTPVTAYSGEPTAGQLLFTGSNGTKARLTYTLSGRILEVDTTGTNVYVVVP